MWTNSYRTPTEHWQETSDFQKGKLMSKKWGRAKEIRTRKWDKGIQTGPVPLGGSYKGGKVSAQQEILSLAGKGRSFRASEESAGTGVQRAKQKGLHTEINCWPEILSLRCLSAHPLEQLWVGYWDPGFRGQTSGRGLGMTAMMTAWGG